MGGWLCLGDREYREKGRLEGEWRAPVLDMLSMTYCAKSKFGGLRH